MNRFALLTATLSALTFGGVWLATDPSRRAVAAAPASGAPVYYSGCNAVRAAGRAPLYANQPGYRAEMDGDGDGIACEPHRRGSSHGRSGGRSRRRR